MKRMITVLLAVAALATTAAAQEKTPAPASVEQELSAALQDLSAAQLGTLTVGDLVKAASRVSIAQQKVQYVQRVRTASLLFPGAGQFMTGNALAGSLFLAGDLAVVVGTLTGAYFLLPANVQFGSLDYLNGPLASLRTAWEANSFMSYLPSMAVMAGGMLVKGILGHFAAANAAADARNNIADGKITFTPNFGFMGRGFGMGMRMRY